jgi:hypothetical protein
LAADGHTSLASCPSSRPLAPIVPRTLFEPDTFVLRRSTQTERGVLLLEAG